MTDSKHYVERVQSTKGDTFESSVSAIIFGGESQKPPSDVISTARKPPRMGRSKPDPFVSTKRMVGALEELPPELSSERWPSKKIADAFAFRLEQKGTSVEAVTRNLQRLMVALHAGVMEGNKVVAVSAPDFQKVAAAWGIIVDRAQAREIFSMRGLPIDAPAPLHVFVRQFTNIGSEHSLLEGSRPRSLTRAPPVDYSGGAAPYAGGRENQAELTRRDLYQTVRSHRREEQEEAWRQRGQRNHLIRHTHAVHPRPLRPDAVVQLHERLGQAGLTQHDAVARILRMLGHSAEPSVLDERFAVGNLTMTPQLLELLSSRMHVQLSSDESATLISQYGGKSVFEFVKEFLNHDFKTFIPVDS